MMEIRSTTVSRGGRGEVRAEFGAGAYPSLCRCSCARWVLTDYFKTIFEHAPQECVPTNGLGQAKEARWRRTLTQPSSPLPPPPFSRLAAPNFDTEETLRDSSATGPLTTWICSESRCSTSQDQSSCASIHPPSRRTLSFLADLLPHSLTRHRNMPWQADGYSSLDFTLLDPHWGTVQEWADAIQKIHDKGM